MKKQVENTGRKQIFDEEGVKLLANKLKSVRKEQGFTQEKLSLDSGVALSQIARIELGLLNPRVSTIMRLARTMKIPVSKLFEFTLDFKENLD